ncbi:V-type proton ATPase subunit S1-like protein [Phodopus roborovskii]|uniref:V-type proton ATPase subunit S1 n=1 Tax=Phodopus roborovskii TaxID=109678 RepID=A0AAU9Z6Q4_PHORO|nr:V-type proton ATPase subunit S1-like protein [Phodopus roborovskii]CAH6787505.1 Atp6ap1l [Phodopus roborovskii]
MGRKLLFSFSLLFLCMLFSATLDQILAWKNVGSQASSSKEVIIRSGQENSGEVKPVQNFTKPVTQTFNYNLSKTHWSDFSHHNPVKFSRDGVPCILFWTKRITVKFKNQTWLDLTDEAPGQNTTVDTGNSNCTEESATLSLRFGDAENPKDIDIRFTLTNYNKLSSQSWFSLHRVEIICNNSVQATFNATGVYALSSYSYSCQRVSSLRRNDALLLLSSSDDVSSLWEVTFIDFQIQGFSIKGAQFAQARDCGSAFSAAVLIGLATSLILLLVLAYALHMLIYLRYLDRHYEFINSPARFPPLRELDTGEEKELLGSQGAECYELRSQQICKIYI